MNEAFKEWMRLLRDPDRPKGTTRLGPISGPQCCLGKACTATNLPFDPQDAYPPSNVITALGLEGHPAIVNKMKGWDVALGRSTASRVNDTGTLHPELADVFEKLFDGYEPTK